MLRGPLPTGRSRLAKAPLRGWPRGRKASLARQARRYFGRASDRDASAEIPPKTATGPVPDPVAPGFPGAFLGDETAATVVEYGLLAGLLSIAGLAGAPAIGAKLLALEERVVAAFP